MGILIFIIKNWFYRFPLPRIPFTFHKNPLNYILHTFFCVVLQYFALPLTIKIKKIYFYLKGRYTERRGERDFFFPGDSLTSSYNDRSWANPKLGAFCWSSVWVQGSKDLPSSIPWQGAGSKVKQPGVGRGLVCPVPSSSRSPMFFGCLVSHFPRVFFRCLEMWTSAISVSMYTISGPSCPSVSRWIHCKPMWLEFYQLLL